MKNKQEIHITTDGKITYAVLKQNGKILSRSEAKCHPDDKFDFETGAKIALDRLEIKKEVKQPENPFKPGDIVEYISDEVSRFDAIYFPPKGTRGEVLELDNHKSVDPCVRVRWEKGTTGGNGEWWCRAKKLKKVESKYSFKVGDIVEFIDDKTAGITTFPLKGTRGKIIELEDIKHRCALVQWGKGTTQGGDKYWVLLKRIKKVESKYSFKVGDRVRFRSWDDMESEFGMDAAYPKGGICIRGGLIYFSHCMRPLCGTYATIETMRKYETGITEVKLKDFSCKDTWLRIHVFSTDMLEPTSTKGYKS